MRILPIAITAAFLALPMQMDLVVRDSAALAKGIAKTGFGDHARPWAADMAAAEPASPGPASTSLPPEAPQIPDTLAGTKECVPESAQARQRQARLKAAEKRVGQQIEELTALRGAIETLLVQQEEAEKRDLQQLVNLYRNMKPKEAAVILEDMDLPIVVSVVLAMKERDAAPILARMPKGAAQNVTREIARRKSLERLNVSGL